MKSVDSPQGRSSTQQILVVCLLWARHILKDMIVWCHNWYIWHYGFLPEFRGNMQCMGWFGCDAAQSTETGMGSALIHHLFLLLFFFLSINLFLNFWWCLHSLPGWDRCFQIFPSSFSCSWGNMGNQRKSFTQPPYYPNTQRWGMASWCCPRVPNVGLALRGLLEWFQ